MNKTVQSILSLTAVSLLLIVITFFFGWLRFRATIRNIWYYGR
nr:MAG TPA: hypothetical protein [Caudoviricetes sp.]